MRSVVFGRVSGVAWAMVGAVALAQSPAPTIRTWEKRLADGVSLRMIQDTQAPLMVWALRIPRERAAEMAVPALAGAAVYEEPLGGRGTVTQMVKDEGAIAGINADFFPLSREKATGDPLGFMVTDGQIVSSPYATRSVLFWGPQGSAVGLAGWQASLTPEAGTAIKIDRLNTECPLNEVTLNTGAAGLAIVAGPSVAVVLRPESFQVGLNGDVLATVESVTANAARTTVPADRWVVTAQGNEVPAVAALRVGAKVRVQWTSTVPMTTPVTQAVAGGPRVLRDGQIEIPLEAEGFGAAFSETRHPRTLAGVTKDGDQWWVVIDGRSRASRGASLNEAAQIMRRLGCVDALNLDGGGSSTLVLYGVPVNRPSDPNERAVANGVTFRWAPGTVGNAPLAARLTGNKDAGSVRLLQGSAAIPNSDIIWSTTGPVWVNPDGEYRRIGDGPASVRAGYRGRVTEVRVP